MPLWKWLKTASGNATADPSINWAEGMAPSAINDSSRAEMAVLKQWADDFSGSLTTGGTADAYTLTTNSVYDSLAHLDKALVCFVPHVGNNAACTLNVDGTGAKPIRTATGGTIGAGVLVQGTPYLATYFNGVGEFLLVGFTGNPFNVPLGGMLPYLSSVAPNSNFALPSGQAISRATYAALFSLCGTQFGGGDGSTTFNLPDLRGRSVFGLDSMNGSAANRITTAGGNFDATVVGASQDRQNWTLTQAQLPAVAPTFTGTPKTLSGVIQSAAGRQIPGGGATFTNITDGNNLDVTPAGAISNLGSGASHPIIPPAIILPFILRII